MNPLEKALQAVIQHLEKENIPYMVIGAVACLAWGIKRATFDVDVAVWAPLQEKELIKSLCLRFRSRTLDPEKFVQETFVLPLAVEETAVDIIFGQLPFEQKAIQRALKVSFSGIEPRVCSPEDLILYKIISDRRKDLEDVRELIRIQGKKLDRSYLDPLIRGLSHDLARPEIWQTYSSCFEAMLP